MDLKELRSVVMINWVGSLFHCTNVKETRVSRETVALPKKFFGNVFGCGAGVFEESGSVNQCGTKGKVYGCKLNLSHRQKPALLS